MRANDLTRVFIVCLAVLPALAGCQGGRSEVPRVSVAGGDADRGKTVIKAMGCGACHEIPGIDGADGLVGPPLENWMRRSFIAGNLPNSPENLIRWITNPQAVEPGTAMPDLNLVDQQAKDIAAYLYTLD